MSEINVAIIGASGYTGLELVRILTHHPDVNISVITSDTYAGQNFSSIYPQFCGLVDMKLEPTEAVKEHDPDLIFLALPHGVSMEFVKNFGARHRHIIDLSGDFRLPSATLYEKWYGTEHAASGYLDKAVYGLPELFRLDIRRTKLIANPGCYPTSAILALAPLVKNNLIETERIIIDAKSGVSGAGAKAKDTTHFPEVFGNFSAYNLHKHRHIPEIESVLEGVSANRIQVNFTPHLLPVDRGILSTIYVKPLRAVDQDYLQEIYAAFYHQEHFVRIVSRPPAMKNVRGSNYCDIYATFDARTQMITIISVIDNLVKGAAGQAVQNMNIMFDFLEDAGLKALPLNP